MDPHSSPIMVVSIFLSIPSFPGYQRSVRYFAYLRVFRRDGTDTRCLLNHSWLDLLMLVWSLSARQEVAPVLNTLHVTTKLNVVVPAAPTEIMVQDSSVHMDAVSIWM